MATSAPWPIPSPHGNSYPPQSYRVQSDSTFTQDRPLQQRQSSGSQPIMVPQQSPSQLAQHPMYSSSPPQMYPTSPQQVSWMDGGTRSPQHTRQRSASSMSPGRPYNPQQYQPSDPSAYTPPVERMDPTGGMYLDPSAATAMAPRTGSSYGSSPGRSYPPMRPQSDRHWSYNSMSSNRSSAARPAGQYYQPGSASPRNHPTGDGIQYSGAGPLMSREQYYADEQGRGQRPRIYSVDSTFSGSRPYGEQRSSYQSRHSDQSRHYSEDELPSSSTDSELDRYEEERARRKQQRRLEKRERAESKSHSLRDVDKKPTLADSTIWAFDKMKGAIMGR